MLRLLFLGLVVVTLFSYLPPIIDPIYFWPIAPLGLIAPVLWMMILLYGAYWMWKKDNAWWLALFTLLLGADMMRGSFAIPDSVVETDGIVVASMNVHSLGGGYQREIDLDEVAPFISNLRADIIFIQEFTRAKQGAELVDRLKEQTALDYFYYDKQGALAILSAYPLKEGTTTYFENRVNGYVKAIVDTPNGEYQLFNVHLQTNAISQMASEVTKEVNLQEKKTWQRIRTMLARYGRSNQKRTAQSRQILEEIDSAELPVILGGDFNDVPTSFLYQLFRERLQDAHLEQSFGWGTTYQGLIPALRIDYLLLDRSFTVVDYDKIPCSFSDHHTIRAKIKR